MSVSAQARRTPMRTTPSFGPQGLRLGKSTSAPTTLPFPLTVQPPSRHFPTKNKPTTQPTNQQRNQPSPSTKPNQSTNEDSHAHRVRIRVSCPFRGLIFWPLFQPKHGQWQ